MKVKPETEMKSPSARRSHLFKTQSTSQNSMVKNTSHGSRACGFVRSFLSKGLYFHLLEAGWGALAGVPLHFSYGRCQAFVLLRQELPEGRVQGGVAPLGVSFLSGVCRGRFGADGNLYACGLNGWQTAAKADGCLQRVRPTGKPFDLPTAMEVQGNTLRLTFTRPLDAKAVAATDNYRAARWNYRWSGEYGSKRWKVSDPKAEGQDDVPVRSTKLSADGRTLEITFDSLVPAMQMMVGYNVKSADGKPVVGSVYMTIHTTGK